MEQFARGRKQFVMDVCRRVLHLHKIVVDQWHPDEPDAFGTLGCMA